MPSVEAERVLSELNAAKGTPKPPIAEARRLWNETAEAEILPEGVKTSAVHAGGVISEWVIHPDCDSEDVFLFLHGGGFSAGGPATHRKLAAHLSKAANMRVLVPDYRLAPEHPFPAGVQDALAVFGALLSDGVPAPRIVVGGDSAGGGLAASMLLALQEVKGPMPAALVMLSPWLDLTNSGETYETNADLDPTISRERHEQIGAWYYDEADPRNPMISPMFSTPSGFPPTLVQVGDIEVMLDDSRVFAEKARAAGVQIELDIWPRMWHVWQQSVPDVPESVQAVEKIGEFVRRQLGG